MGLEAVGNGLKTRIATITDIARVFAPSELPKKVSQFPSAIILPSEMAYDETMGALQRFVLRLIICLSDQDQPTALARILDFVDVTGADSVVAAVDADPTLGGAADSTRVMRNLGLGSLTYGGTTYLSTEFEVEVYA